jgi:cysteine desulfurase/selenocysteine lyase
MLHLPTDSDAHTGTARHAEFGASPDPAGHGLPDEAGLMRLANQFFALLPGQTVAQPATPTPAALPASVAEPAPSAGATMPSSPALELPANYAPALPQFNLSPFSGAASPISTPYYFIGEASALPSVAQSPSAITPVVPTISDQWLQPATTDRQQLTRNPSESFYFLNAGKAAPETAAPLSQLSTANATRPVFDVHAVRRDFPILAERINGRQLIWLDNAATTHKPQAVIDRLAYFYAHENSNIHRAAHELAARATDAYEAARLKVARFLGAKSTNEIIFVRGATEGINLVAQTFGKRFINAGDEIIVSHLEHHANIVPWQLLAQERGAVLRVIPVDDDGQILLDEYAKLLNSKTRLVAVTQVSNALGTITPVQKIVQMAHQAGARALIDGAQAVSHMRVDVSALDADFYVFSGHKVFAPTGIGAVYGKQELLEQLPPWQGGGNMIRDVTFEHTEYNGPPTRFEAGTGNIADAVGLGAAIDYVERLGMDNIAQYEHALLVYATQGLKTVPGLTLIGTAPDKASVLSFVLEGYRPEDVGTALNQEAIAVRSGHHCAQPILRRFGHEATVRPSLAFYNTCQEVDTLVYALKRLANKR